MKVGARRWNEGMACDGRGEGRRNGIKEHLGGGSRELAGRNTNGNEGACDPNHGSRRSKGVSKVAVICEVVLMKDEELAESH